MYNEKYLKEKRRTLRRNQTAAERRLWTFLRHQRFHGLKFFRQYSVGPYILDFYCPRLRLAIEVDGRHHAEDAVKQRDAVRTAFMRALDIRVVRFWNAEVLQNMDAVLSSLGRKVNEIRTPPASPSMKEETGSAEQGGYRSGSAEGMEEMERA